MTPAFQKLLDLAVAITNAAKATDHTGGRSAVMDAENAFFRAVSIHLGPEEYETLEHHGDTIATINEALRLCRAKLER